jgi:hypothetical protein
MDRLPAEGAGPRKSAVRDYLGLRNWDSILERIHHALYIAQ